MNLPFPGIGVVFDIDGLGGGYYGYRAWKVFMKSLDPRRLGSCVLVEGDTSATLNGRANEFCIGVYGMEECVDYVRETFENVEDAGLAPLHRRFIEKMALDPQPLPIVGRVDLFGRLVTDEWSATEHRLCLEHGWGFRPEKVPPGLEPSVLAELEQLARVRLD
jgi:hypothetical protein